MMVKLHIVVLLISSLLMSGCTTLHSAAAKGNVKAIERLHGEGEDIDGFDDSGITPLIHAINCNQKESLWALLKAGANVNKSDSLFGNTPLHHAILQGNMQFARILLDQRADVSLRNNEGETPLDLVLNRHNDEMVRLIKSHTISQPVVKKEPTIKEANVIVEKVTQPSAVAKNEQVMEVRPVNLTENRVDANVAKVPEIIVPKISDGEANAILKRLMSKHETLAIRNFLNQHPEAISLITDPRQQLRFVGPNGWRLIDIAEAMNRGVMKEKGVIDHIEMAAYPYKHFTEDEIRIILHYGISMKIIDAMMKVTP